MSGTPRTSAAPAASSTSACIGRTLAHGQKVGFSERSICRLPAGSQDVWTNSRLSTRRKCINQVKVFRAQARLTDNLHYLHWNDGTSFTTSEKALRYSLFTCTRTVLRVSQMAAS